MGIWAKLTGQSGQVDALQVSFMTKEQVDRVQELLNETLALRQELYGDAESYPTAEFNLLVAAQTQFAVIIDLSERE